MVAVQRITSISTLMDSAAVSKDKACVHADFSHALITVLKMTALGRPCCASICANRCASAGGLHIPVVEESISTNLGFRAEGFEHKHGTTSKLMFRVAGNAQKWFVHEQKALGVWVLSRIPRWSFTEIWRFPEMGGTPSHHPFRLGIFHDINHLNHSASLGYPHDELAIPNWIHHY